MPVELLTMKEMGEADRLTIESGIPGFSLMQTAGQSIAHIILRDWTCRNVLVLCGPGNNGGDGYIIAEALKAEGWPVRLASLVPVEKLTGDAARAADQWSGEVLPLEKVSLEEADLVVDALFGAGLTRALEGREAALITRINEAGMPVIAVDIPSGICGDTGRERGAALKAHTTVTFFRKKPGHLLYPGRAYCGVTHVTDIGIADSVLDRITPQTMENGPALWENKISWPDTHSHKYTRGSAVVFAGGVSTGGAARLSAQAALRSGAGLVTLACPKAAIIVNACHLDEVMLERCDEAEEVPGLVTARKTTAALIGPASGYGEATREKTLALLDQDFPVILDADALTSFEGEIQSLLRKLTADDILTPHEGEFGRIFVDSMALSVSRLAAARLAAVSAGAVIVLKGADTIIAAPDGRAAINSNGTPWLATAGSGDVLAGIVTGLAAQGMPAFESAAMAVWLHAEAGSRFGPGLIASDLTGALPGVLDDLYKTYSGKGRT